PSELAAEKIGIPIETFLNKLYLKHKEVYKWFNISYDIFSRTSKDIHTKTVQEFFKKINENGFIEKAKIKVFYSQDEKRFLPDRYIKGECPKCGYKDATGDQCENCTSLLDPLQLINPKSALSGGSVSTRDVEHLFLKLDKLSPKLKKWIVAQKHWRKQVSSLALGWIKEGLKKRCITRDLKHGVPVPLKGFENKVFYVWFDAPIGYLSFTKEVDPKNYQRFWKNKESRIYHFLGKDNIPFHTIFWPGMILAHKEYNLPYQVVGLQYLNYEGGKFSKSKNYGVFCERLSETKLDSDVWRAYLSQILPETGDTEFNWKEFQERVNSDLIGNYGNFFNRFITFINNKLEGEIIEPSGKELTKIDKQFLKDISKKTKEITDSLEKCELRRGFAEMLAISSIGNKYFNDAKPWEVVKDNPKRASHILYLCATLGRTLAILSSPFLPNSAKKIWKQLNLKGNPDDKEIWDKANDLIAPKKYKINKPERLFSIIEDADINKYREQLSRATPIEDFFKK
ncbi:MAG: methionine--tRNA ligase, partial [Nanoarchaeota archaeon]